ncbi:MAG TPA: hypothetical protein VIP77_25560 [Jiangellaceae bacterium]
MSSSHDTGIFETTPETAVHLPITMPLSLEEMVAALHYEYISPEDIASERSLRNAVTLVVGLEGLEAVQARARQLAAEVDAGTVEMQWLSYCRERVTAVFASPASGDGRLHNTRRAIIRRVHGQPGLTPKAIAAALGMPYGTVKRACSRIAHDGQLSRDPAGRYFPPTTAGTWAVV